MINLLDYNDCEEMLQGKLKEGITNHELIYVQDLRGIGKTYQLIELAKKHGWIVVEPNDGIAKSFREQYKYAGIYGQTNPNLRKQQVILTDELVNIEKLLIDMECDIITGFTSEKKYTDCNTREILKNVKNYKVENESTQTIEPRIVNLVAILNDEIIELVVKIIDARKDNNMGTYKNLIIALKEVVQLKDNEENKKNSTYALAKILGSNVTMADVIDLISKGWKNINEENKKEINETWGDKQ